jgi:flagellar hook-length control protein FliK
MAGQPTGAPADISSGQPIADSTAPGGPAVTPDAPASAVSTSDTSAAGAAGSGTSTTGTANPGTATPSGATTGTATTGTATPGAALPAVETEQLPAVAPDGADGPAGASRQHHAGTDAPSDAPTVGTGAYPATSAIAAPGPNAVAAPAEPSGSAAPATPAAHATQLAERLVPLRKGPDGLHRLTIHLNPVDLGPISVTAEIRGGDIHVHLAGATDAAREALRAALPELRKELQGSGFGSSSLDVSRDAPGQDGAQGRQAREHQPAPRTAPGREERTERYRGSTGHHPMDHRAPRPGRTGLDLHV